MSSGTSAYSQITGIASDILSGLSSMYEDEHKDEYNQRISAYDRELERIRRENQVRADRVRERNDVMAQMGGGLESRSPTINPDPTKPLPYSPNDTAENLQTGADILGAVSDIVGSSNTGSSSGDSGSSSISDIFSSGVDINSPDESESDTRVVSASPSSSYTYDNRYDPNKRYLTKIEGAA